MTPRDREFVIPEMLVIVGSCDDAVALSPLATVDDEVRPTLVATGPDPLAVDELLDELGRPAGRILLPGPCDDPGGPDADAARELAVLLPRLDRLMAESAPAAVVVRGGTAAALAAAQAAAWRGLPVIALPGAGGVAEHPSHAVNRAMIAEVAAWQTSEAGGVAYPARLDLLVHQSLAATSARVVGMTAGRAGCGRTTGLSA